MVILPMTLRDPQPPQTTPILCIFQRLSYSVMGEARNFKLGGLVHHYCRLENPWVMLTSVYIPSTDRCFLLSLYLVFKLCLYLCVLFYMHVSADYVACKRH